jgi:hypothetical protein
MGLVVGSVLANIAATSVCRDVANQYERDERAREQMFYWAHRK